MPRAADGELAARAASPQTSPASRAYAEGLAHLRRDDFLQARDLLRDCVRGEPRFAGSCVAGMGLWKAARCTLWRERRPGKLQNSPPPSTIRNWRSRWRPDTGRQTSSGIRPSTVTGSWSPGIPMISNTACFWLRRRSMPAVRPALSKRSTHFDPCHRRSRAIRASTMMRHWRPQSGGITVAPRTSQRRAPAKPGA